MEEDRRSSDWWARAFGALGVLLLAVTAGLVFWPDAERTAPATAAPVESAAADLPTLLEQKVDGVLRSQIDALLNGDEKAWLAPVDMVVRSRYRAIYRNLRGLEISRADYDVKVLDRSTESAVKTRFTLGYCLSEATRCPAWDERSEAGAPKVLYDLTFTLRRGSYVVTSMTDVENQNHLQPTPWERAELRFVRGKRAIVAGPAGQARNLKRVLTAAEKAATVVDRFAVSKPDRYRIYVADDKAWERWYGGKLPKWAVGYHIALNQTGSDIILRASEVLDSSRQLGLTVQHEMAHAATLVPSTNRDAQKDLWLIEGIAEYIGFDPEPPQRTESRYALRTWTRKHGDITSIVRPELTEKSDDLTVSALYATGHYAVGCMVDRYGQEQLLDFVQRVLQRGEELDPAARAAFGKPFATVDKACVTWIKQRV